MTNYQLLIPSVTIFFGLLALAFMEIRGDYYRKDLQWIVHTFVLALALLQQILLYRLPATLFLRGGLVLDGLSQTLSLAVLILSLLIQMHRRQLREVLTTHSNLLSLSVTLFSILAIQSNRYFFGVICAVGLLWAVHGALAAESPRSQQPKLIHSGMIRGLVFLIAGTALCILTFSQFGETQIDEIQKSLIRGGTAKAPLLTIEILIVFVSAILMGIPPFSGLLGTSRSQASWSFSLGFTGILGITGLSFFIRWGLLALSRPAVGGLEVEPLTEINIALIIRLVASVTLVLTPFFALMQKNIRKSFSLFCLNPLVQALFALSFGQKEAISLAISHAFLSVFVIGLLISTTQSMRFSTKFSLAEWMGIGRVQRSGCLSVGLALASAAGLAPFFGSELLQKTLSINSWICPLLIVNVCLAGAYAARFTILGFHRGSVEDNQFQVTRAEKVWFATQVILLIFMGIFWQPLYKYGALSIRSYFGEL